MLQILRFLGTALTFLGLLLIPVLFIAFFYADFAQSDSRNRFLLRCSVVAGMLIVGISLSRLRLKFKTKSK